VLFIFKFSQHSKSLFACATSVDVCAVVGSWFLLHRTAKAYNGANQADSGAQAARCSCVTSDRSSAHARCRATGSAELPVDCGVCVLVLPSRFRVCQSNESSDPWRGQNRLRRNPQVARCQGKRLPVTTMTTK
jgi:hypothetical protein